MTQEEQIIWENLTDIQREIAELVGMEGYIRLMKRVNGHTIYVPKYSDMLKPNRNKEILEKFNGYNFEELAKEYDLTVKSIYNIIPQELRETKRHKASQIDGQIEF